MNHYPDFSNHNYQIIRELGRNREGGRISYLACPLDSQAERVVIKQFRFLQGDSNWQGFKAYEREIKILQTLDHPSIPKYLDSLETADGFCLVQEYKNAPSLGLKSQLSPEDIKAIAISVLEILVDLQNSHPPVIHRDIKPENILVDENNQAYLVDFGLARIHTEEVAVSSIAAGTPGFMPPEEIFNRSLTVASDLYSLGATLICLLTNTRSLDISNLIDENYRFNFKRLVPELNPRFITWLTKMVEPNLKDRYANAAESLAALKPIELRKKDQNVNHQLGWLPLTIGGTVLLGYIWIISNNLLEMLTTNSTVPAIVTNPSQVTTGKTWFNQIKPRCNSLEVTTAVGGFPPPNDAEGAAYAAGCYALAGKIKQADQLISNLPENEQAAAAEIVFNIGHPVADAGDDESAGPIMQLVLKYSPKNYMALYHAGMSEYTLGDLESSQKHLNEFLNIYHNDDGWRKNALIVLQKIEQGVTKTL